MHWPDREPAALLEQLNTALLYGQAEQLHAGKDPVLRFVTAVVARIEPTADGFSVLVARAGQPPPVIVRSAGTFEHVEPKGVLLGVCQDPVFEEARVELTVGDTLDPLHRRRDRTARRQPLVLRAPPRHAGPEPAQRRRRGSHCAADRGHGAPRRA